MSVIALDAMGGDHAPEALVKGVCWLSRNSEGHILLVGDHDPIKAELDKHPHNPKNVSIIQAEGVIPMDAKPKVALDALPRASLPLSAQLVASGEAQAFVSAGNTGAVILSCARAFKRLPGVKRTALAAVYPTEQGHGPRGDPFSLMLDVGANIRVSAQDLIVFALMGSAYASVVSDNPSPRVALLNNGTESNKGPPELVEAHRILSGRDDLHFMGNIEGVDIPKGTADVVICDGFTGNVVLKMLEGVNETVQRLARYAYRESLSWKIALALLSRGIRELKNLTDWQQYGGAPILGFDHLCIKAHGRSSGRAISNAIRVARKAVDSGLLERIARLLENTKLES
ncbi:MAG: phosphate acyltransferase PlsX [Planctomycetota bacterium]|nr:phosphate acyltransferase PlsX [Planctomycetota bacterium]